MMRAIATLTTLTEVKGVVINPHGIEVGDDIPILDCHSLKNRCLGHLESAWVEDNSLKAELVFTGTAGRRVYRMIERGELNGVSCGLKTVSVAILDAVD